MSRHRDFRKLDIDAELDDDALSDGGEEYGITAEQEAQLNDGLAKVRRVIGDTASSGLSDKLIKDVLWDNWFDVEKTTNWAFEEQDRRNLAMQRRGTGHGDRLPPVPFENESLNHDDALLLSNTQPEPVIERPRIPSIFLAQQRQQEEERQEEEYDYNDHHSGYPPDGLASRRPELSTIEERTEYTKASPWPPQRQIVSMNLTHYEPSSPTTSYGQVIEEGPSYTPSNPKDPNFIPVSPSMSAMQRLSVYEPPPSNLSSGSRTPRNSPPKESSAELPPQDGVSERSNANTETGAQSPAPPPVPSKKSKLSTLASSRGSTQTKSSWDVGVSLSNGEKTYPIVRPSSASARHPSIAPTSQVSEGGSATPVDPISSSASSHIRRAIETAMLLEAPIAGPSKEATPKLASSQSLTPSKLAAKLSARSAASNTPIHSKEPSKESSASSTATPPPQPTKSSESPTSSRQPSKLALLAQAKANRNSQVPSILSMKAPPAPKLPAERTEILTPIANGSSVTTAITTSYQSLYSLTDPNNPPMMPALSVVPLGSGPVVDSKQTKLAMKIKKAYDKMNLEPVPLEEVLAAMDPPIFDTSKSSRSRALPSAFASLLLNDSNGDIYPPSDKQKDKDRSRSKSKERRKHRGNDVVEGDITMSHDTEASPHAHKHRSRKHKHRAPPVPDFASTTGFQFNEPSPDDIVFNARRGTALAHHKLPLSAHTPHNSSTMSNKASSATRS
ncbi:hypothetical protein BDN72DRAFT_956805 [Pluteus cervinus]|uniref:Uncharacterized protein n=1 Tax=Pluteus cervinus TaxID=181527 RepID=A0ACD3B4K5_9AGAR|nr:hypothetical protein BDN72DRAFT_956805 [Pluteus cervinus]